MNEELKNNLTKLYDMNYLNSIKEISLNEIFLRKVNLMYYFHHTKTKSQFIKDKKVQTYFETKDKNLLGEYYEFIKSNKNVGEISKYNSITDVIKDPNANFIKGSEIFFNQGERAEKFILHMLEKELSYYFLVNRLLDNDIFPASLILNSSTNEDNVLNGTVFKLSDAKKKQVINKIKERNIPVSCTSVDLVDEALKNAIDHIKRHTLDANGVSSGTDRLTLIIPSTPIEGTDDLTRTTNFLIEQIQDKTFMNTIEEYKINLSDNLDRRTFITDANRITLKGNENTKLVLGKIEDYPALIRSIEDKRLFIGGVGFDRIDRLKRDWIKLTCALGIDQLFYVDSEGLRSSNAVSLATNEFKLAIAKRSFGELKFSQLSENQKQIVHCIIKGYVQKMENSIAQHQMIEFMRSGRWPEPKDLGIGFSSINTIKDAMENNLLIIKKQDNLVSTSVGDIISNLSDIIQIPLRDANGTLYIGIIDKDTFFAPQTINTPKGIVHRFGITKFIDRNGIVRYFDDLDMFSIEIDDISLFSRAPLQTDDLDQFRRFQEQVYNLVFSTVNQGHQSNFILGRWMPEVNILSYAGTTASEVENLLGKLRGDFPITFNHYRSFDVSEFGLKWNTRGIDPHLFMKIIERVNTKSKNPIILTKPNQNGETMVYVEVDNYVTTTRVTAGIHYENHHAPVKYIQSPSSLLKFLIPEEKISNYLKGWRINKKAIAEEETDIVLLWFGKLPIGHRSFSNSHLPSPLGGLTAEIYSAVEPPVPLIEIVEAFHEKQKLTYLHFRPPTGTLNDYSLMVNKKLNIERAESFLKHLMKNGRLISFLATYFNELMNYFHQETIMDFTKKHGKPFELSMIEELKQVASGITDNLVKIKFKMNCLHLKNVFVWFDPKTNNEPVGNVFTILDLRMLPGHFPQNPDTIDPEFLGTKHLGTKTGRENLLIFKNKEHYYQKIHYWIEAQLRRILNRLTLDKDLFEQNLDKWCKLKLGNTDVTFETIFGKKHILEIAKRYLVPGHTLAYDENAEKVLIKRTLGDRPFRSGAYLTPIFLDPKLFAENKKQYRKIIQRFDINIIVDNKPEPVLDYRKTFEADINAILKMNLPHKNNHFFNIIQNFKTEIGKLKILFARI